jgi:Leucine-rich repeat (LRR) protein
LSEIGNKEGLILLRDFIDNSGDPSTRKRALEIVSTFEKGKNFTYFEQLFLSDEDPIIRMIAGKILKDKFRSHKKLNRLLEYTLRKVDNIDQKIFAIRVLNSIESVKARKILRDYLNEHIKTRFKDKTHEYQLIDDYNLPLPETTINTFINIILSDYYKYKRGFLVTSRKGRIIALNCESSNVSKVSDIFGFNLLSDLKHLSLRRNSLSRIVNIFHLTKLKTLNLSHNKIEKIENLQELSHLEELDLSNNKIKKIENLEPLQTLQKLFLNDNSIRQIENLHYFSNLEILNLSHNLISDIKNLDGLEKLERINLSSNNIQTITGLNKLINLMWLYLNDNKISRIEGLSTLTKLKGLYLSNNSIENIGALDNLINLKKLELSNNKIIKLEGLKSLVELQELYLDNNSIKIVEGLGGLKNIIMLHIGRNRITEFRQESIKDLKNLNFLFLNENPLDQKSIGEYQKRIKFP